MNKLMVMGAVALVSAACFAEGPKEGPREGRCGERPPMGERQHMGERPQMGERGPQMGGDPLMFAVMNPRSAEALGLSDEQKAKLKEVLGPRDATRELNEKIRKGMERQMELLKADSVDEAAVMAAIDEVFEARKAVAKDQTKRLIAVRAILTSEQIAKATEMMKEHRRPHRHGR